MMVENQSESISENNFCGKISRSKELLLYIMTLVCISAKYTKKYVMNHNSGEDEEVGVAYQPKTSLNFPRRWWGSQIGN